MCSAFAHVVVDMLRSIAVIVAAVVVKTAPVSPEMADGAAALVVLALIVVSVVPVVREMTVHAVPEYRAILARERAERQSDDAVRTVADPRGGP